MRRVHIQGSRKSKLSQDVEERFQMVRLIQPATMLEKVRNMARVTVTY